MVQVAGVILLAAAFYWFLASGTMAQVVTPIADWSQPHASIHRHALTVVSAPTLTPAAFALKWRGSTTTEKAASQEHFIDLCRMVGEPTPNEADPTGEQYAFERRVEKAGGGDGFADVWKRGFFAWEYKGHKKDLKAAYLQLLNYKDDLGNPPLLVVSDLDSIEIRTNFTGLSLTVSETSQVGRPSA